MMDLLEHRPPSILTANGASIWVMATGWTVLTSKKYDL